MNRGSRPQPTIGATPTRATFGVLITLGACFLLYALAGSPPLVRDHLALTPRLGLGREPWQLVTSGFIHLRFAALLSSAITIFFFGSPIEQQLGSRRLITLMLGATVAGSLGAAAVGRWIAPEALQAGAQPACMALLAAFGVLYARMPLSLFGASEMRGSTLALIFLGISAAMYVVDRDVLGGSAALGGALYGWLAAQRLGMTGARSAFDRFRLWRLRRRYRVIPGGRDTKRYLN